MQSASSYPDWKAPAEDGQILVWPTPREIAAQTLQNQKLLSSNDSVRIGGIPLNTLRRQQRALLGHSDDARPLVATGHQTELIHPGVWVKHVLINATARVLNGAALQFAVDTDGPKHLTLRWPGGGMPVTDDARITSASWSGLLDAPSPNHLARLADHFLDAAHQWDFQTLVPNVIASLRPESRETEKLSEALVRANHSLDQSLGLSHAAALVSPMLLAEPYLAFVHHVMSDAANFAGSYNAALARYRTIHKTKSTTRPMPDLFTGPGSVEAPFWLDDLADGSRSRPSVFPTDEGFILELLGGEEFDFRAGGDGLAAARRLGEWLAATQHRLSPRALTLTTYIRMLIADNFIHGIGGGRYDQVSDDVMRNYFKIAPPAFAVTTATMFFPARCSASAPACLASSRKGTGSSMPCSASRSATWSRGSNPRRAARWSDNLSSPTCTASARRCSPPIRPSPNGNSACARRNCSRVKTRHFSIVSSFTHCRPASV